MTTFLDLYVLENCTDGVFKQQTREINEGIFIQYCSGGNWHYLCSKGVNRKTSKTALATVVCRQFGYSDQGIGVFNTKFSQTKKTNL